MTSANTGHPPAISVRAWRDYDEQIRWQPDMDLGRQRVQLRPHEAAPELYRAGVRRVAVDEPVDLRNPADPLRTAGIFGLVRDLTSYVVVVDWELITDDSGVPVSALTHLSPPTRLDTDDSVDRLSRWRREFRCGRYGYRHGPGFVQVRDWRSGKLRRLTIDDPAYLAAIPALLAGAATDTIAPAILRDLAAAGLVAVAGGCAIWLPYRIRRWPFGAESGGIG